MTMQSPEQLLPQLNKALRRLRSACSVIDASDDASTSSQKLLAVMRRLLLAEVLNGERRIVAVGGSQGAGKTTLMASLYAQDLKGEYAACLQGNEGRGEKMPILIVEDDIQKPQCHVHRLVKDKTSGSDWELKEVSVNIDEFQRIIRDPAPGDMLPVLRVPHRYFKQPEHQAWLLLPGYEKEERSNRSWQQLMRQAMITACGCIVVTDETRMANQQQLDIVNDMLQNELRGQEPYIVISPTAAYRQRPDRLADLRKSAEETFQVPQSHIICSGTGEEYKKEWLPHLEKAIYDLNFSGTANRSVQISNLDNILNKELGSALRDIRSHAMKSFTTNTETSVGERVIEDVLEAFDDAVADLRNDHLKSVEGMLGEILKKARKNLDNGLKDNHEGFLNWIGSAFDSTSETAKKMESLVEGAWKNAAPRLMGNYAECLQKLIQENLGIQDYKKEDSISITSDHKSIAAATEKMDLTCYEQSSGSVVRSSKLTPEAIQDIRIIFNATDGQTRKLLEKHVKLIPAVALGYARQIYALPEETILEKIDQFSVSQPGHLQAEAVGKGVGHLSDGVELGKTAIRSLAAVLAVDVASDGDLDLINKAPTTSNSGQGETGMPPVPLIPNAAVIATTATVAALYLSAKAISGMRSREREARWQAHQLLGKIRDDHVSHFYNYFDELMRDTRDSIRRGLRDRYHMGETLMRKDQFAKAMADVKSLSDDLRSKLSGSEFGSPFLSMNHDD